MLTSFCCLTLLAFTTTTGDQLRAVQLWQAGQKAMYRGENAQAIDCFEESLGLDPHLTRNYLSLSAVYLDLNQESKACLYLGLYVAAHPDQASVRGHYAELLLRLKHLPEAREQYEQFVARIQAMPEMAQQHLIECHSRLMQIGEQLGSSYEEHLHRGIGLLLLALEEEALPDEEPGKSKESLLCQAAGELTLARRERPDEARPHWYLFEVWTHLVQSHPAQQFLHRARAQAPFSYLSPHERQQLYLALHKGL